LKKKGEKLMTTYSLKTILEQIPDPRMARGQRYTLISVLLLACAAMLCGYHSYSAIAEWGTNYGSPLLQALGLSKAPCAATFCNIFRELDVVSFEQQLQIWSEAIQQEFPPDDEQLEGIAIDGKTLRGSRKQGAPGIHLLSALGHRLGLTLGQLAVADKTNEITAMQEVLAGLILAGRVITMDALLTQREIAKTIIANDGNYVMIVKGNQPKLHEDIAYLFSPLPWFQPTANFQSWDSAHGRLEERQITVATLPHGYLDWPGAQQVFQIERTVKLKKSQKVRHEIVYGITNLTAQEARANDLLTLVRHHCRIENWSHWVRDVTFDEDRSQVRVGSTPQIMAGLRNLALGLMRSAGITKIAATTRRFAAQPQAALALMGISI
jgi:predicted transposase YbfD/YdcC